MAKIQNLFMFSGLYSNAVSILGGTGCFRGICQTSGECSVG